MLFKAKDRKVNFDIVGPSEAPVVYFAHSLAADSGMWVEQVPEFLSAGYRVLRVDMRGHGGTDPGPGNYSMETLVADAVEVLDCLQIERVHFCGLSIGGMIAQGVGILHPKRVISLILCDTQAKSPDDAQERWGGRIRIIQPENSMEPIADATVGRWLTEEFKRQNPNVWKQIRDTVAATPVQGYIGCAAAIQNFDWTHRLAEIAAPTFVLWGSDDPAAKQGEGELIAAAIPRGEALSIEGARHLPNLENSTLFNRLVIDWCKRND